MGSSPESQGQRGIFCCVIFPHCADVALFPTSRENLGPDAPPQVLCVSSSLDGGGIGMEGMKSGDWVTPKLGTKLSLLFQWISIH